MLRGRIPCRAAVLLFGALLLLANVPACTRAPALSRDELNLVLITLDTTRRDQLGCYGNDAGLTPNLDALAREGVLFEEAVAPAPLTLTSHASILTGLYPFHHGIRMNGFYRLAEEHVSLAEVLKGEGFATAAVVSAYVLDHTFKLDQGFDSYDDDLSQGAGNPSLSFVERGAAAVTRSALRWLEDHAAERFFLWVHFFDPHLPYDPPTAYATHGESDLGLYQGEIAYMDDHVGRVVAKLREMGLYDKTVIVATGDHGEAFGTNGEFGHGLCMYNSTLLTPLIVRIPRVEGLPCRKGRRVTARVSLVDVSPTILDIIGISSLAPLDGESLLPYMEGRGEDSERMIYAETAQGKLTHGWCQLSGIYDGQWKYILAPTPELYDLKADPREETNLASEASARAEEMKDRLLELVSRPSVMPAVSTSKLDPDAIGRLQTLGYITGSSPPEDDIHQVETDLLSACQTGRDIKEVIELSALVDRGMRHLGERRPMDALRVLKKARDIDSTDIWVLSFTADAYTQLRMYDAAIDTYLKVLELQPDDAAALNSLAVVYHTKGEHARAAELLRESIKSLPAFFKNHLNLANIYDQMGEKEQADREYRLALELAPEAGGKREEVLLNMAFSLFQRGEIAEARRTLETILEKYPDHQPARSLLERIESLPAGRR